MIPLINETYKAMLTGKSVIRELNEYANDIKQHPHLKMEDIFDYSLGNPSVPVPEAFNARIHELLSSGNPMLVHGYSPSLGIPSARDKIAASLNRRFGMRYTMDDIFMTSGAAGALAHAFRLVTKPGDEILTFAPFFPEYRPYTAGAGLTLRVVPANTENFQINFDAFEQMLTPAVQAVLINSPNNPVGAVYTRENLEALAAMLEEKGKEIGHPIYLISDEPYREITYGVEVPYVPTIYPRTLVCYSYSKALSLPGERVGYVYVSDTMDAEEADRVFFAVAGAGRAHGYICAPVLFQRVAAACVDEPSDVEAYATNRRILTEALDEMGYEYVQPDGAFYLWVRALEPDAQAFSDRAKQHELLIVPSDSFGVPGWVRMSYCIARETIENSLPALKALKESYDAE